MLLSWGSAESTFVAHVQGVGLLEQGVGFEQCVTQQVGLDTIAITKKQLIRSQAGQEPLELAAADLEAEGRLDLDTTDQQIGDHLIDGRLCNFVRSDCGLQRLVGHKGDLFLDGLWACLFELRN